MKPPFIYNSLSFYIFEFLMNNNKVMGCSISRFHRVRTSNLVDGGNSQNITMNIFILRLNKRLDIHHYELITILEDPKEEENSVLRQKIKRL